MSSLPYHFELFKSVPFEECSFFSQRDRAFAQKDPRILDHIPYSPDIQGIQAAIKARKKYKTDRSLLVEVLTEQYQKIHAHSEMASQIQGLLSPDVFTVVTAHQPSLALGPLYTVYKTISAISLAQKIHENTGNRIIPVFVIGGEDHDFEEISTVHIQDTSVQWNAGSQKGAVGRMSTLGLEEVWRKLKELLPPSPHSAQLLSILSTWRSHETYGVAVQEIMHKLFGQYGLVVLRMDDHRLKRSFLPHLKKELVHRASIRHVLDTQDRLLQLGFQAQAMPRDINLFYLYDGDRRRIEYNIELDQYTVVNSQISWSGDEVLDELEEHPERFSPNVIMRPLYQEHTLPNIAYVGGGGELAYWQERWSQFENFGLFFPVLVRRDSFALLSPKHKAHVARKGFSISDFFVDKNNFEHAFAERHKAELHDLAQEKLKMQELFSQIKGKLNQVDSTLAYSAEAAKVAAIQLIDRLDRKVNKAIKRQHHQELESLFSLREELFPQEALQERRESFLLNYSRYGSAFFDGLLSNSDPLDMSLKIVLEPRSISQ